MDFFSSQDEARKQSSRLVLFFAVAVTTIIAAIYLILASFLRAAGSNPGLWDAKLFFSVAGGTILVIGGASLFKVLTLGKHGGKVAMMLGGVPVTPNTTDTDERKLMNIVEEMSIASGVPVPEVYVLPNELGINAFAAGMTPAMAAIGVTKGCIQKLTRDELQGVIAHEFSHILNGDMRMNLRLMGVLNGLLVIGLAGYFLVRAGAVTGRSRNGAQAAAGLFGVGAVLFVLGYIGLSMGRLIKAAVSRQREFLADASAVQFTRNPDGIASALKKIGGFSHGSRITHRRGEELSHSFFGNGMKKRFFMRNLLATHPPLDKRIRALDKTFDGEMKALADGYHAPEGTSAVMGLAGGSGAASSSAAPAAKTELAATPDSVMANIGTLSPEAVSYSAALIASFSDVVRSAAREPYGAQAIVYAALLDEDNSILQKQMADLEKTADPRVYDGTSRLAPEIALLGPAARLPLVDLALPALRLLSTRQYHVFERSVKALADADDKLSLFEYTLQKILLRHLGASHGVVMPKGKMSTAGLRQELALLISTLAYAGHDSIDEAKKAYELAMSRLNIGSPAMSDVKRAKLTAFDVALDQIARAKQSAKRQILEACAYCVAADGKVTIEEAELLRAIADTLDCPMPPFLPTD